MAVALCERTVFVGLTDPPLRLGSGESFTNSRVVIQAPTYGRVLFTEAVALEVQSGASGVFVGFNTFEFV